jgi:calpain
MKVLFGAGYTGLIEIRLWRYGQWVSVFIDDRLPQRRGAYCYAHSSDPTEFWVKIELYIFL